MFENAEYTAAPHFSLWMSVRLYKNGTILYRSTLSNLPIQSLHAFRNREILSAYLAIRITSSILGDD